MDGKKKIDSPSGAGKRIADRLACRVTQATPRDATEGLLAALIGFLLGNCALPFATYPLGIALLCASSERTLYIAVGLLAAAFTAPYPAWLGMAVTVGTLLVRIAARIFVDLPTRIGGDGRRGEFLEHLRGRLFCEGLYLRLACACVSVFSVGLYAIVTGGFRYYDLFGAIFSMVVAPVAVFLFAGLFSDDYERLFGDRLASHLRLASKIALVAALCYSLSDTVLSGIPLALVFAFVAVLVFCRRYGFVVAFVTALACGLLLGLAYVPVLLAVALVAFCIFDTSPILAAAIACVAGTVCGVLTLGGSSMSSVFLPLFSGTAVYCTVDKFWHGRKGSPAAVAVPSEREHVQTRMAVGKAETEKAATALEELSGVFEAMSKKQKYPSVARFREACAECLDGICAECGAREACREGRQEAVRGALVQIGERLAEGGRIEEETLPEAVAAECLCAGELVARINKCAAVLTETAFCSEKAELFALDYGVSAGLLRELSENTDAAVWEDGRTASAIRNRLEEIGYAAASVSVIGTRQKKLTVTGLSPSVTEGRLTYLEGQMSHAAGFPIGGAALDEKGNLTARRLPRIQAAYGSSLSAKEGVCGDVVSVFCDEERGYVYALLDDGMGSGEEAALTAQLGSLFLRKLLPVGIRAETVLRMLNQFLRRGRNVGGTESCTTVDLLILDLVEGRASFLKSGAAPTYVKRGKNIFYLDSKTAPVGILREISAKQIDFEVKTGDVIVMVSDGITGGENECLWLLDHLDATNETDPKRLAEHIVARAAEINAPDDLSAIVVEISET